jgi:hypothetical protein
MDKERSWAAVQQSYTKDSLSLGLGRYRPLLSEVQPMLLELTRSHLKVKLGERTATIQGELCRLDDGRMGFVIYSDTITNWDEPHRAEELTPADIKRVIDAIGFDFSRNGHTLLVE